MRYVGKRRSFSEGVERRRRLAARIGVLIAVFFGFELLSGVFLTAYTVTSMSMAPAVLPGDLVLASPFAYGPRTLFGKIAGFSRPERGDLILVEPPYAPTQGFLATFADSFVRFISFQRFSLLRSGPDAVLSGPMLQRVVGLPGDDIQMEAFVFMIKPAEAGHFLTEFELSARRYDIQKRDLPEGWKEGFPGSGFMPPLTLGKDEYFLAGDARSSSSDSRYWGPLHPDRFRAKVLLRYWPPSRFGLP